MTPGMRELIRYMAYIAVQEYVEKIRIEKLKAQKEVCDRQKIEHNFQKDSRGGE